MGQGVCPCGRTVSTDEYVRVLDELTEGIEEPSAQPASMVARDEALLLWNWLSKSGPRIVSVERTLALPAWRIPHLGHGHPVGEPTDGVDQNQRHRRHAPDDEGAKTENSS